MIIIANWKMNKDLSEVEKFMDSFISLKPWEGILDLKIFLAPSFPLIKDLSNIINYSSLNSKLRICAQNCHHEIEGAFTGEVSAKLLNSLGVDSVIIGHSERRNYFDETNDIIEKKISNCIKYDITPILCFGENLNERKKGNFLNVIESQINILNSFKQIDHEIILAYEPVWAIGSGLTPSIDEINEVHFFVKNKFPKLKVLYGGSLNFNNAKDILSLHNVDGGLVGGASLDPSSFSSIIHSIK
tara:strand:- start:658 stop:1389 length:732 start_codon:yes stop_codon:yes gene_type:complete